MITPTERRVLQLAADGLSNHQIRRQLGYCESAVATTFTRIYAKLGLSKPGQRKRAIWMYFTGEVFE